MAVELIVFDLDGTLIDSRQDLADATNAMLVRLGAAPLSTESVAAFVGEGAAVLVRRALIAAGLETDAEGALDCFLSCYDERLLVHTHPYDGIRETLATLKTACALAVLTNKPTRATHAILTGLDLAKFFDGVVGGDSAYGRKPKPEGLESLITALGAGRTSTVLVGDSRIDLETARRADVRICLARYGFGYTLTAGDFRGDEMIIDHPWELTRTLELA